MGGSEIIKTTIPHSAFGAPNCCGCMNGRLSGNRAEIVCNKCGKVVQRVPAAELRRALDEMELELDVASAKCPHCGAVHVAPGFSKLLAFVCDQCGQGVNLADES